MARAPAPALCTAAAATLVLLLAAPASAVRMQARPARSVASALTGVSAHRPLCDAAVVAETCLVFNEGANGTAVSPEQVRALLSAAPASASALWALLGLTGPVECRALCAAVVAAVGKVTVLPPESDRGCVVRGNATVCTVDLDPAKVLDDARYDGDLPDFHDRPALKETVRAAAADGLAARRAAEPPESIEYGREAILRRAANLFRIYPAEDATVTQGAVPGASSLLADAEAFEAAREQLQRVNLEAIKYVETAIRMLAARRGDSVLSLWFGSRAPSDPASRREILRVLNSVSGMLGNVEYVYPGPQCSPNTYAYVYPKAYTCSDRELSSSPCTKNNKGNYIFYMCDLTMRSQVSVQIETLTHEGSHHATAFTDDVCVDNGPGRCQTVAYGRSTCQTLARTQPAKALKNADSFCYYIQDLTDR